MRPSLGDFSGKRILDLVLVGTEKVRDPIKNTTSVVSSFKILKKAWKEAKEPQHREHVMPYFYEGVKLLNESRTRQTGISPRGFNVALLHHTTDFGDYRWTVDTPEDLEFMRQVYGCFNGRDEFTWKEVLDVVHDDPGLMKINAGVQHKTLKDLDTRAL
jgi:spore coat polysaccharide biosynthesis protein SpsF